MSVEFVINWQSWALPLHVYVSRGDDTAMFRWYVAVSVLFMSLDVAFGLQQEVV